MVDFIFFISSLTTLFKSRERRDIIIVENIKRRIIVLRVSEEDVYYKVIIISVLLSFNIDKLFKIFIVDNKISKITI